MSDKKGFTLVETIVVMIIVGILAVVVIPNINTMSQQAMAEAAVNNVKVIANAEKNYYFSTTNYCLSSPGTSSSACRLSTGDNECADILAAITCNLSLNINDSHYQYQCVNSPNPECVAKINEGSPFYTITWIFLNPATGFQSYCFGPYCPSSGTNVIPSAPN